MNFLNLININLNMDNFPDFILIDGRYRVLTILNILKFHKKIKKNKTCILLDDFKNRNYYNIIQKFYRIKIIGRMAKLEPKPYQSSVLKKYIKEYIFDAR